MKKRYKWIDFAKALAIIAVVFDHTIEIHNNQILKLHTAFSVALFILLAGVTSAMSISRSNFSNKQYFLKKIKNIFIPYIFATFLYFLYNSHFKFDWLIFAKQLVTFSAGGPFYFIYFFLQLIFLSPLIYKIFIKHEHGIVKDVGLLFVVYLIGLFFNKYTYMGPFWGGGRVLLGGSFLFVFCLGFLIYKYMDKLSNKIINITWLIITLMSFIIFENYQIYSKSWSNPPNIFTIFYTLIIFSLIFTVYNLGDFKNKFIEKTIDVINLIGKNSFYIFLYHSLIIQIFLDISLNLGNTMIFKVLTILSGIIIPVIIFEVFNKVGQNRKLE